MGHKILLADDSITVQKIVKLTFLDEGIEVVAVGNGELALQQLMDWQPDLVMADVFMPGRDGYEVCQFIKSSPELCRIPVVLLVHAFEPFDQARAVEVRADRHLTKPFHSIRTLVTTVRELIQHGAPPVPASESPLASSAEAAVASVAGQAGIDFHTGYETAPLTVPVQADSGEVIELKPQPEADLRTPPVIDFQPATEPAFSTFGHFPARVSSGFAESGQLLTITPTGNFSPGFGAPVASPEPLPEPETMGLLAVSEPAEALSPEISESRAAESAGGSSPGGFADLFNLAEPVTAAPVSPLSAVSDNATEEVLELEDILTSVAFNQVGEMDILSVALPLQPGAEVAAPEPFTAAFAAPPLLPEPDALPVLAEVADSGLTESEPVCAGAAELTAPQAEAGQSFFDQAGMADAVPSASKAFHETAPDLIPGEAVSLPVTSFTAEAETGHHTGFSPDHGVGQPLEELSIAAPETFAVQEAAPVEEVFSVPESFDSSGEVSAAGSAKQDSGVGIVAPATELNADSVPTVSPALIDEIVNRVVARLSEKAIQQIAWEVVPEMAEVIIRKQLAEKQP